MDRKQAWDRAVAFLVKSELRGDVHEFGCFAGRSLTHFYNALSAFEAKWGFRAVERFFAFDSFAGMPTAEDVDILENYDFALSTLREGNYACSESDFRARLAAANFDLGRLVTIPGYYSESLSKPDTRALMEGSRCALLHIDCDFASSTRDALDFIEPYLQDGVPVLFDDWFLYRGRPDKGVQLAFNEWLEKSHYTAHHYFSYSWCGNAFILHDKRLK